MSTRRSNASKWGSQSTGATGSLLNDSRIADDNGFGPFWKLKTEKEEKYYYRIFIQFRKFSFNSSVDCDNEKDMIVQCSWKMV